MAETVGDFVLRRLREWGVEQVFAYPGDGINGIVGALERVDGIEFVQVRHEEMAAFMACGHAKFTGEVGVCIATSGPGATNLVTPIADAYMDSVPIVAITGQVPRPSIGTDAFQEADIQGITLPITKHNFLVQTAEEIPRRSATWSTARCVSLRPSAPSPA